MFPRLTLTKASTSSRSQQPVHIPLQPMSSPPSTSAHESGDDLPERSYPTPLVRLRQRSVSSSSIASLPSSHNLHIFSWRDMLCIPLFPLVLLQTASQSSSRDLETRQRAHLDDTFGASRLSTATDISPIHGTFISSGKGKGKAHETSPLLETATSPTNENRFNPPSWTSAIPISLVID